MSRTCDVAWMNEDVMEFTYQGVVEIDDLEALVVKTKAMMSERTPLVQLVDTLAVERVPREIGAILSEILNDYRARGGSVVIMVATEQLTTMLGRSMSFGAGLKLQLCDNRVSALKFVREAASDQR